MGPGEVQDTVNRILGARHTVGFSAGMAARVKGGDSATSAGRVA